MSLLPNIFTRVTTTNTWTEIAGATKGLAGAGATDEAELDVLAQNWAASDATILFAVTANSTAPASDDAAFFRTIKGQDEIIQLQAVLIGTQHLWLKSTQNDTRVNVTGSKKEAV